MSALDIKAYIDTEIGLIRVFEENDLSLIEKENTVINGTVLKAGDKTTLNDFFEKEVIYLGHYNGYMQFQVGKDVSLFGTKIYTNEFKKIDDNRILTIFKLGTARDFIYKNGAWK